jgi:hypothetical protein
MNIINPATQYVVFRASSTPLIKAYPKGTSFGCGSQRKVMLVFAGMIYISFALRAKRMLHK